MDMQKEREAFELDYAKIHKVPERFLQVIFEICDGKYKKAMVQASFELWQAAKASAVPDGYVLVPKEPTEEMIYAGYESKTYVDNLAVNYKAMIEAVQEQGQ